MRTTRHAKLPNHERAKADREIIARKLDEIAAEVGDALRGTALDFSIYMAVPATGDTLVSFATTADPSAADWAAASATVCRIVGEKLGRTNLATRALRCCVANAELEAAEVIPHADPE